jgi:glycosyltransferase involved in cell wall biosynthesis
MKAAIYNAFWPSMGGGERHAGYLAQTLAADGHDVTLIGHDEIDLTALSDRLGLDLSGCRLHVVDRTDEKAVIELSATMDLFVNGSYMSRLAPAARHNMYLCYFPTPADTTLTPAHKVALRALGPWARRTHTRFDFGTGWYPPEGGLRRSWRWTGAQADLMPTHVMDRDYQLSLSLARLGQTDEVQVSVELDGISAATWTVGASFTSHSLTVPADCKVIRLRCPTFQPSDSDPRELGVAVAKLSVDGAGGIGQQLSVRYPWLLWTPWDFTWLEPYGTVLANSAFTAGWIERLWHRSSELLFPPVDVTPLVPAAERTPTILSVGRFFAPGHGHSKRQLDMVRAFGAMVRAGDLPGWTFTVIGGCEPSQQDYLDQVRTAAAGLPVEILVNADRASVVDRLTTASIFWSATGLGEDEQRSPWTFEHFGITTCEAMAGGTVPVVIDRAGQREIVRQDIDGYRWGDEVSWRAQTLAVARDESLRARLSAAAVLRAAEFSEAAFVTRWHDICARAGLA